MTLFNTWVNFKEESQEIYMEENTLPSETQPDEVLTVREMLERHVHGLPINGNEGVYLPEEVGFIPDYRSLDLTEMQEYRDSYADIIQQYNNPEPAPAAQADTDEGGMRPAPQAEGEPTDTPKPPQA